MDSLSKLAVSLNLPGKHNQQNAMAAAAAAIELGVSRKKIQAALKSFKGVPHRLETVAVQNGVTYINDSKSTNVDSTEVALDAIRSKVILILGGRHKGSSYKPLRKKIKKNTRYVLTIGEASNIIEKDLGPVIPVSKEGNLKSAVKTAKKMARKGDTVLFSPACASFDQFLNFEKRGEAFARIVKK